MCVYNRPKAAIPIAPMPTATPADIVGAGLLVCVLVWVLVLVLVTMTAVLVSVAVLTLVLVMVTSAAVAKAARAQTRETLVKSIFALLLFLFEKNSRE